MTGFGRTEAIIGGLPLVVEIASVNQKSLQVSVHGPECWPGLESMVAPWIRARLIRGKINVRVTRPSSSSVRPSWNSDAISSDLRELEALAARNGIKFSPDAALLLRLAEAARGPAETLPSIDVAEPALRAAFDAALDSLKSMRATEGAALASDLSTRIAKLSEMVRGMEQAERDAPRRRRDNLLRRLAESGLSLDPSDERVLKEVALFADRCDVTEEIVRLRSHLQQFLHELSEPGAGRKLDFLIQELLREVNTVGSKAVEISTTRLVLEAKTEIERVREQVQNLE